MLEPYRICRERTSNNSVDRLICICSQLSKLRFHMWQVLLFHVRPVLHFHVWPVPHFMRGQCYTFMCGQCHTFICGQCNTFMCGQCYIFIAAGPTLSCVANFTLSCMASAALSGLNPGFIESYAVNCKSLPDRCQQQLVILSRDALAHCTAIQSYWCISSAQGVHTDA